MTNTESPARPYVSEFAKAAALVEVERVGFYFGPVTDAMQIGLDEGFLQVWPSSVPDALRLTDAGRERLAGFRALLAPAE